MRRPRKPLTVSQQIGHAKQQRQRDFTKAIVHARYGSSCACCGTTDDLSVDHVNGDGREHRKTMRGDIYLWLIQNGLPDGFQILCSPCSTSKSTGPRCRIHQDIFNAWPTGLNRDLTMRTDIPGTPL